MAFGVGMAGQRIGQYPRNKSMKREAHPFEL
jgi:hypothetical protein